jgi:hypothetical protein
LKTGGLINKGMETETETEVVYRIEELCSGYWEPSTAFVINKDHYSATIKTWRVIYPNVKFRLVRETRIYLKEVIE